MRKAVVISLTIAFFTLLVLAAVVYFAIEDGFSPVYDKRLSQHPLTQQSCLLVYENSGGGAMTGYSHAFFLLPSCDAEIDAAKPFLNTADVQYCVSRVGDKTKLAVYGDVYNLYSAWIKRNQSRFGEIIVSERTDAFQGCAIERR